MKRSEGWIYGGLLAAAFFGAGLIVAEGSLRPDDPAPDAETLADPRAADEADLASGRADLPADFVPDLPAVPTLEPGTSLRSVAPRAADDADERMDRLAAEMRLVVEARDSLPDGPAEALALLDQHRARFPDGALVEEREALAIEALLLLRHTAEVERRFHELTIDYPGSRFIPRLREQLATAPR